MIEPHIEDIKALSDVMRRVVANHGSDSRRAAFDAFVLEMTEDLKYLAPLIQYYFEKEYPKWHIEKTGISGSVVVVAPERQFRRLTIIPPEVRAQRKAEIVQGAIAITNRIVLMNLRLPCGKLLREATFADLDDTIGWMRELKKHGKPTEAIDKKLTEADLQNVWKRFQKEKAA